MAIHQFPCPQCGADLTYAPDAAALCCSRCGHEEPIADDGDAPPELDYATLQSGGEEAMPHEEVLLVSCGNCGAETRFDPNVTAGTCPFCDAPMVAAAASARRMKPQGVIPFQVTEAEANEAFEDFRKGNAELDRAIELVPVYLPFWTFDVDIVFRWSAWHGHKKVRREQVEASYDDLLVPATEVLPRQYLHDLASWDLDALRPFHAAYLSGFRAESYDVNVYQAVQLAEQRTMESGFTNEDRQKKLRALGDDATMSRAFRSFRHIVLPLWLGTYEYRGDTYYFMVNGQTGQVGGEGKAGWGGTIILLILLAFAAVTIYVLISMVQHGQICGIVLVGGFLYAWWSGLIKRMVKEKRKYARTRELWGRRMDVIHGSGR